ncbi:hypothetical protein DN062_15340 [Nitrincola tibetensis]|uniref:Group II intron reverse transcriptase/maturase n=1 Tax=Nitrincola tibetensis TaxID=2219697 RepID=A0A364NJ54_9GAMM|nr:hypothetical protein [Nitrincola tibetensis]RAU16925.1 hypothetical protein DN062_15340 [Nitrincola tibetensis]
MKATKPFKISKSDVVKAWELVKFNKGASGADGETIEQFKSNLGSNPLQALESHVRQGRGIAKFLVKL